MKRVNNMIDHEFFNYIRSESNIIELLQNLNCIPIKKRAIRRFVTVWRNSGFFASKFLTLMTNEKILLVKRKRDKDKILYEGYAYNIHRVANDSISWRCVRRG
ncbi:hypothetical protein DMUE_1031 [Dictyocoela muelleri]|nr:hypothetical protein DMUE_1031 [Dictyocoela muelleri]